MNAIWEILKPYILYIAGSITSGGIITLIAVFICKRIIAKASAAYNHNELAAKVADKLGGKTIEVDITSIVEKRLKEISDKLAAQVGKVADETNSYKHLLALIGAALTHLKMLTDEEREELAKAINELDSSFVPPEKEVVATVKLEPIAVAEPPASDKLQTVNME